MILSAVQVSTMGHILEYMILFSFSPYKVITNLKSTSLNLEKSGCRYKIYKFNNANCGCLKTLMNISKT